MGCPDLPNNPRFTVMGFVHPLPTRLFYEMLAGNNGDLVFRHFVKHSARKVNSPTRVQSLLVSIEYYPNVQIFLVIVVEPSSQSNLI